MLNILLNTKNILQIHGLSTVLEDQRTTPPSYSHLAPKHFELGRTKASHLESVSLCSFCTIILHRDKYIIYVVKHLTSLF